MERVSYKTEKVETESGIEETKTVSIEFQKEGSQDKKVSIERTKGVTTISITKVIDDPHEFGINTIFQTTIEDEKLKQAVSYLGEMFLTVGKLAVMEFMNESMQEET
jgi:hypothetical protein